MSIAVMSRGRFHSRPTLRAQGIETELNSPSIVLLTAVHYRMQFAQQPGAWVSPARSFAVICSGRRRKLQIVNKDSSMYRFATVVLALTATKIAFASNGVWQRSTGVGLGRINDVCWADETHAWLATSDGSLLTTGDGGKTWQSPTSMFRDTAPSAVRSINIRRRDDGSYYGWAASGKGVFYTADGRSWTKQEFDKSELIELIGIIDQRNAWAASVGRGIWRTEDRGKTWTMMVAPNLFAERGDYEFVDFPDRDNGTAIVYDGQGWALHTTRDGGETWLVKDVIKVPRNDSDFVEIKSAIGVRLYAGDKLLYRRGKMPAAQSKIDELVSRMIDDDRLYPRRRSYWVLSNETFAEQIPSWNYHGPNGDGIQVTNDGGKSWRRLFYVGGVTDFQFTSPTNGVAIGAAGRITRTTDGGQSWTTTFLPARGNFQTILFLNEKLGWIAGGYNWGREQSREDRVWQTKDGGASWRPVGRFEQGRKGEHGIPETAHDILFKNEKEGWIATHGSTIKLGPVEVLGKIYQNKEYGRILHTTDGGETWKQVFVGVPMKAMSRQGDALIAGGYDIMFSPNGTRWRHASGSPPLKSIAFVDDWRVVYCGESSGWITSSDAGQTWQSDTSRKIPRATTAITFVTPRVGWAAHMPRDEELYRGISMTSDGGKTWTPIKFSPDEGDPGVCWTIKAVDPQHAWAIVGSGMYRFIPN